mmetsp:Transcript_19116/g.73083  ORF Transcript_19116/g.73083 Transcript_19116/m.73083 type:complete len:229 (-) Transcript_19116:1372-2058(-)
MARSAVNTLLSFASTHTQCAGDSTPSATARGPAPDTGNWVTPGQAMPAATSVCLDADAALRMRYGSALPPSQPSLGTFTSRSPDTCTVPACDAAFGSSKSSAYSSPVLASRGGGPFASASASRRARASAALASGPATPPPPPAPELAAAPPPDAGEPNSALRSSAAPAPYGASRTYATRTTTFPPVSDPSAAFTATSLSLHSPWCSLRRSRRSGSTALPRASSRLKRS